MTLKALPRLVTDVVYLNWLLKPWSQLPPSMDKVQVPPKEISETEKRDDLIGYSTTAPLWWKRGLVDKILFPIMSFNRELNYFLHRASNKARQKMSFSVLYTYYSTLVFMIRESVDKTVGADR